MNVSELGNLKGYGKSFDFSLTEVYRGWNEGQIIAALKKMAVSALPEGSYFDIRKMPPRLKDNNTPSRVYAWYFHSLMDKEEASKGYIPEGGFYHLGTFRVDGKS